MPQDWILVTVIGCVFLLGGGVKGALGMGLPTVSMGLLAIWMPPVHAAALILLPSFATNVWQLLAGPALARLLRRLWAMMAGICAGTIAGAGLLAGPNTRTAAVGLGLALVAYAVLGLCKPKMTVPLRSERWLSPVVGVLTGLVTGATGVFVIPAVPYLQSIGLQKDELVQALGLSFTVSTVALAAGLGGHDALNAPALVGSVVAMLPASLGMLAGQAVRKRLSAETFRKAFFFGLIGLGAYLAIEGLVSL
jgi:uncharacterized membrane protein YfcA